MVVSDLPPRALTTGVTNIAQVRLSRGHSASGLGKAVTAAVRQTAPAAPRPSRGDTAEGNGVMVTPVTPVRPAAGRIGEWTGLDPSACVGVSLF